MKEEEFNFNKRIRANQLGKELVSYNRRKSEGIVHTKKYVKRMKRLQEEYIKWVKEQETN